MLDRAHRTMAPGLRDWRSGAARCPPTAPARGNEDFGPAAQSRRSAREFRSDELRERGSIARRHLLRPGGAGVRGRRSSALGARPLQASRVRRRRRPQPGGGRRLRGAGQRSWLGRHRDRAGVSAGDSRAATALPSPTTAGLALSSARARRGGGHGLRLAPGPRGRSRAATPARQRCSARASRRPRCHRRRARARDGKAVA
jgi:hypothetical protein